MKLKKIFWLATLCSSFSAFAAEPQKITFPKIKNLSAQGDLDAQARLGEAYLNGQQGEFDYTFLYCKMRSM